MGFVLSKLDTSKIGRLVRCRLGKDPRMKTIIFYFLFSLSLAQNLIYQLN